MTQIELRPSRAQRQLILFVHVLVVLLVLLSNLAVLLKLLALVFCLGSYHFAERSRYAGTLYKKLLVDRSSFCLLDQCDNEIHCELKGEILSTSWLIILNFLTTGVGAQGSTKKISLVLFKDAVQEEDWRKLRVSLRTLTTVEQKR